MTRKAWLVMKLFHKDNPNETAPGINDPGWIISKEHSPNPKSNGCVLWVKHEDIVGKLFYFKFKPGFNSWYSLNANEAVAKPDFWMAYEEDI